MSRRGGCRFRLSSCRDQKSQIGEEPGKPESRPAQAQHQQSQYFICPFIGFKKEPALWFFFSLHRHLVTIILFLQQKFGVVLLISYLCGMTHAPSQTSYVRTAYKTTQYQDFYNSLPAKVQSKFDYVLNVMVTIYNVPVKFIKHLENTNLYEMRVSIGTNEYRTVIFAIDNANFIEANNIVLLNGFLKKDNKDYRRQIETAKSILKALEL